MYEILKNKTERTEKNITDFAAELIATPSPSLEESDVALIVEKKMRQLEYDRVFRDDWGNVIGIIYGHEAEPTVVLNAHMDTVPQDAAKWASDPFKPHVENGMLYGAGASDCKSGIASQVYAGAILKHSLLPLRGNLVVAATVAEQNGRSIGVRALIEETLPSIGLKADSFILGEPTGLNLIYGHDGWVHLDIRVEGEQPFHVEDVANGIYQELEDDMSHKGSFEEESFQLTPPRYEQNHGSRRATIGVSRKIAHGQDIGGLLYDVSKNATGVAENYGAVAVQVAVRQERQKLYTGKTVVVKNIVNAWSTDPYHPLIERSRQTLAAAGINVQPAKWQLNKLEMGTAGSLLTSEFKIPTIGFGPGLIEQAHAVNECVPVANLARAAYGAAAIVHGLIGIPVYGWTSDDI